MGASFAALLPVFLLIVAGVVLRRLVPQDRVWSAIGWLVYYVAFPALFIVTLARADFAAMPAASVGGALTGAVLVMSGLCLALRPWLVSRFQLDGPAFTSLFQGATRWQTSVALAVAATLFGEAGLARAAVGVVAMTPLLNVINVSVLARFAAPGGTHWTGVAAAIAKNPFIWGCAIGVALNALPLTVPEAAVAAGSALGRLALVLGLLTVGAGLRLDAIRGLHGVSWVSVALKLVVMPATAIGLGRALGVDGIDLAAIVCCASVPSTSSAYVLARQMGGDAPLMAEIITVQTLLAIVSMPMILSLVGGP